MPAARRSLAGSVTTPRLLTVTVAFMMPFYWNTSVRRRDVRLLDHLAPFGDLVRQHRGVGLARAADRQEAELDEPGTDRRIGQRLVEGGVESGDDLARRAGRDRDAE